MRAGKRQQRRYIAVHNIELTPRCRRTSYHTMLLQGGKRHVNDMRSTVYCSITLDMIHFQNPQYGAWRSSSVESSHQVLMKQTSTTSVTICFEREPRSKRRFLQLGKVSNSTLTDVTMEYATINITVLA